MSKNQEGFSGIIVVDQNIKSNTAESSVRVVFPSLLDIDIADVTDQLHKYKNLLIDDLNNPFTEQLGVKSWDNNWVLIEDHYYLIKLFLFDKDKNNIFLTDNTVFKSEYLTEYFELVKENKIKSEYIVRAKKETV